MISVSSLTKVYHQAGRDIHALAGIDLAVRAGTVHGVIGPSGAGKSTLVRCLALLDRPTSGTVTIDGADLASLHSRELRAARRRLGVVFQHANLFDARTLIDNVAYPLEIAGLARRTRRDRASELLDLVGLADAAKAYPAQLSGGQRQRVGIARALATDPHVLLCDEPTSALDPRTTREILELIRSLQERLNLAVLVITHEMQVVKHICDAVSLLDNGVIVQSGSIADVVSDFGSPLSEALLGLVPRTPDDGGTEGLLEVLEVTGTGDDTAVAAAARHFDVHLPVVAGTVERLAGTTFHRLRILVPHPLARDDVADYLTARGAHTATILDVPEVNA